MVACRLCGKESQQKCSGCLTVSYCSKEHQKQDWKNHKTICCPFKIIEVKDMGRCLVASRNIQEGEVLLRERPLVTGPSQVTPPVCLGCHNLLEGPAYVCDKCGWPMCSKECSTSNYHKPECNWAQTKRKEKVKISSFGLPHPTYACITPLRILYAKKTDNKFWSKMSSLEAHTLERKKDGKWEQERFAVAKLLRRFYKLESDVTEDEILYICGILQINGHEVPLSEPGQISVYWKCSYLEHNCRPNCSKSFLDCGDVLIRSAVAISRGERLSICYTDSLWGTSARLLHLKKTKYFSCNCQRCSDPTEFGTYFSALPCCDSECQGKLLPSSFSDPNSYWTCNVCYSVSTSESVGKVLSAGAYDLANVDKEDPSSCRKFLIKTKEMLTDNHFLRTEIKMALAQVVGQTSGYLSDVGDEWLEIKESLSRDLIALAFALFPAECRIRGVLNFELQVAVTEITARKKNRGLEESTIRIQLLESRKYLEECIKQLKHEPQFLQEGKICKQAQENLKDLDKLLCDMSVFTLS